LNILTSQIKLDMRSNEPIYLQIVRQMQDLVTNGKLKPGDQLPTVREMATELRVNFNTVARAYRLLDESGLISTQRGRGTYIWELPDDGDRESIRQQTLQGMAQNYLDEAARLGYSAEEALNTLTQLTISATTSPHLREEKE
jgi:GntR family transcriptional regulator